MIKIDPQTGNIGFGDIEIKLTMKPEELTSYSGVTLYGENYTENGKYARAYFLPTVSIDYFKWQAYIHFSGGRIAAVYFYCADILADYGENPKAASIWWKIHVKWIEQTTDILERQLGVGEVSLTLPENLVEDGQQYLNKRELKLFCESLRYPFNWGEVYRYYHHRSKNPAHVSSPYDFLSTIWVEYSETSQHGNWDSLLTDIAEREQCAIACRDEEGQQRLAAIYKTVNHLKTFVDYNILHYFGVTLIQFCIRGNRYISIRLETIGKQIQYKINLYDSNPPRYRYTDSLDEIVSLIQAVIDWRI